MFKHNLKIIFRGFFRFKNPFVTNLIGLSTGLASVILIYLWVNDELMFDRFHEKGDRLFQVMEHDQQDGTIKTSGHTADFLAATLKEEMPEIEYAAVTTPPNFFPLFTLSADGSARGVGKFIDKDFLKMFSCPIIFGDSEHALGNKGGIMLSESLAKKLFVKAENSLGKTVEWKLLNLKKEAIVSGVYKDLPANSSDRFDFIQTFDFFKDLVGIKSGDVNWDTNAPFFTYVMIKPGTDIAQLNNKLSKLLSQKSKHNQHRTLFLKQYADNYLHGQYENGKESGGRIEYVILFSTIAIFILLIACINFMNLSTAQTLRKAKETGIKKVIGAPRANLIFQYVEEAFIITVLSFLVAIVIVKLALPQFNLIAGKSLELALNIKTIIFFSILITMTTLAAGGYPALYLSRFNPQKALKGQFNSSFGELWARRGLVVFQFLLSVVFIVFVLVVYKQIEFIQTKNLGYDKQNIIYFEAEGKASDNPEPIISEIRKMPGVAAVSSMLGGIVSQNDPGGGTPGVVEWNGRKVSMNNSAVNFGMIELLGMQMKEGRTFSRDFPSDVKKIIFNEAAIEALGIENPVGKNIDGMEVLGVVKNFHYESLHQPVKPYCFRMEQMTSSIWVKIQNTTERQSIEALEKIYKSLNPGYVFNYSFLESDFQKQYIAERRVSTLSKYATGLTVLISCLGLFGLVVFATERRRKEIGIRKVLGSTEFGVVMLLSNEFMRLIVAAVLFALPTSYFIAAQWLGSFAYKIDLKWWYFGGAAIVMILISWLTVASQTLNAARRNPATVLKTE
jgi:ABC-type antimicrobial peptide transport system permease subunit